MSARGPARKLRLEASSTHVTHNTRSTHTHTHTHTHVKSRHASEVGSAHIGKGPHLCLHRLQLRDGGVGQEILPGANVDGAVTVVYGQCWRRHLQRAGVHGQTLIAIYMGFRFRVYPCSIRVGNLTSASSATHMAMCVSSSSMELLERRGMRHAHTW